jgi:membrane protein YdbS with pleckstrin-like domain
MKCADCDRDAPAGSLFCPYCGRRFDGPRHDDTVVGPAAVTLPPTTVSPRATTSGRDRSAAADAGIYTEEELWSGRYSHKAMLGTWIAIGAISIGLVVAAVAIGRRDVWIIVGAGTLIMWLASAAIMLTRRIQTRYRLTTQRLILEEGLIKLTTDRIDIIDIDDITVEQGLIGRILAMGTIIVRSNDKTHGELAMKGIEDVNHVADLMDNARRAVQRRRGLRIDVNASTDAVDPGHAPS